MVHSGTQYYFVVYSGTQYYFVVHRGIVVPIGT
jgi:hypothetical protein